MKKTGIYTTFSMLLAVVLLAGCKDPASPGFEYAPQMYHSIPLEPFTQIDGEYSPFADSLNAQVPPEGVIARGIYSHLDFEGAQTDAERARAGATLKNPVAASEKVLKDGKTYYEYFCAVCHGKKGLGDGNVPNGSEQYAPPPAFNLKSSNELKDGEIFYNMTYGKNAMGSYAAQLTQEERWKVVHYVRTLLKQPEAGADTLANDNNAPAGDNGGANDNGNPE